MDRRAFIKTAAAGAAASLLQPARAQGQSAADLIFLNGPVVTMNSAQPVAEAVAVRGGRIAAVGKRDVAEALRGPDTQVVDLQGNAVSPGLIDAHSHPMQFGQMEMFFVNLRPPRVHDFESLRRVIADAARRTPKGEWIVGRGFNEFDEGRFPRRHEIDPATPDHPVLLIHWSGQYGIANTRALREANLLGRSVADPYGGKYLRYQKGPAQGEPDGLLLHYAAIYSVYHPRMTQEQEKRTVEWAAQRFVEEGVTCIHDNFASGESARQCIALERAGKLPLRVRAYPYVWNLAHCRQVLSTMRRYQGALVRLQGVKLAVDGYPLMYEVPPELARLNIPMHPGDQFQQIVSVIHGADLQVDVHAVGDRGVDLTLDAFSKAAGSDAAVRDRRHRIEHFMFRKVDTMRRAAEMGVPVCTQPLWIEVRGDDFLRKFGWDYASKMVPVGSFLRAHVIMSFGADVPASPSHRPLDSIRAAMTRRTGAGKDLDRSEAMTFMQGIEAHTIKAAYAAFDEKELGSIEVGKQADLAVWNMDLNRVDLSNLHRLKVTATYLAGRRVHPA